MWFPIQSKYNKKQETETKSKKEAYKEQATNIEKELTRLIVQMIDDDAEDQATILLRNSLKKLQMALRFLR